MKIGLSVNAQMYLWILSTSDVATHAYSAKYIRSHFVRPTPRVQKLLAPGRRDA